MRPRIRLIGALAFAAATSLFLVPAAQGDTADPVWKCRASLAYLQAPGQDPRLEPLVANGGTSTAEFQRPQCVDDSAGFPEIVLGGAAGDPGKIVIQGPFARTTIDADIAAARDQRASAAAGAASVRISDADGAFVLEADVTEASAAGSCVNGVPTFDGDSRVVNLTLNGTPIPLEDALVPIANGINGSPLVQLLRIDINSETTAGDASSQDQELVRRALHVQLINMDGQPPALEAVVGEARVGRSGAVCSPPPPPPACPAGFAEVGRQADGSVVCQQVVQTAGPCPAGFSQDPSGACVRVVVLGAPGEQACPGDQVRDIEGACRAEPPSRCVRGRGVPWLGTNRADRITGTNRPDRILAFGGRDRVSGGRGNDCIEGGSGNDNLDGSNNNDTIFGGTGRDIMNGGTGRDRMLGDAGNDKLSGSSGNDRLLGGSGRDKLSGGLGRDLLLGGAGRDYIEGGPGGDRVKAGSGNDVINLAESGAGRDIVDCGSGHDVVRVDSRDRVSRNCERVLITIRRR